MSTKTKIEWAERTWNPTIGCNEESPGCANCYANMMARRLQAMNVKGYENGFKLTLLPGRLDEPLKREKSTMYFVDSMSDLFHEEIPDEYIQQVLEIIRQAPQHIFQILTKRAKRMTKYFTNNQPPENAWIGVTVEDRAHGLPRIDELRRVPASVRFISMEPLLEDLVEVDLTGIHWVIVGGESGHRARPMKEEWVLNIKRMCEEQHVAFFFKQWGTWGCDGVKRSKKANGRMLEARAWDGFPRIG